METAYARWPRRRTLDNDDDDDDDDNDSRFAEDGEELRQLRVRAGEATLDEAGEPAALDVVRERLVLEHVAAAADVARRVLPAPPPLLLELDHHPAEPHTIVASNGNTSHMSGHEKDRPARGSRSLAPVSAMRRVRQHITRGLPMLVVGSTRQRAATRAHECPGLHDE